MKRTITQLGTLAFACVFSTMAFGQALRLDVKPRGERVNELMKPGAMDSAVTTKAPKGMNMDFANDNKPVANDNQKPAECKLAPLNSGTIYSKISGVAPEIKLETIAREIRLHYLTPGNCAKPLVDLKPEPLANAVRLAIDVDSCMSGQDAQGAKGDACRIQANKHVFGFANDNEAKENAEGLKECAYLGEKDAA